MVSMLIDRSLLILSSRVLNLAKRRVLEAVQPAADACINSVVKVVTHIDNKVDIPSAAKILRGVGSRVIQAVSKKRALATKKNSYMVMDCNGNDDAQAEDLALSRLQRTKTEYTGLQQSTHTT
jgi:vacuolar-type H+-ATPase subunit E/Vma4